MTATSTLLANTRRVAGTGLYFGARAGLGVVNLSLSGALSGAGSASSLAYAPVVGYEIALDPSVSVGVDASLINFAGGTIAVPGVGALAYPSSKAAAVLGGLTLHW